MLSLLAKAVVHRTLAACQPVMSLSCWLLVCAISNKSAKLTVIDTMRVLLRWLLLLCCCVCASARCQQQSQLLLLQQQTTHMTAQ
jgi:hypothetical protein